MSKTLPPKEYYSPSEFAAIYGMHIITVQRMCREGRLPAVMVGKRWKIRREAK